MISDENRELLLKFAAAGFEFFPLVKAWGGKKLGEPKGWPTIATSDLATINMWLETAKYGFGMTFGSKRYFAIDLDGENGVKNFKSAMDTYGISNPSLVFSTPSGGRHLIYAYPPDIGIKNVSGWCPDTGESKIHTNIDIRAEGGYIGSFGARDNGYKLIKGSFDDPFIELPKVIIEKLPIRKSQKQLAASAMAMTKDMLGAMDSIDSTSTLYGVIPKVIFNGERDSTLFNLIASWVRNGTDRTNIIILLNEAISRCEGDVSDINVNNMVDRTLTNPNFLFAKRSTALQVLLKDLVFLSDINRYMTIHDKGIMIKDACETKYSTLIEVGAKPNGDAIFLPLFKVWKADDSKMIYRDFGYKPSPEDIYFDEASGHNLVNMYVKPDIKPEPNQDLFDKFMDFATVICNDADKGIVLVEFIAHIIQNPAVKIGIAPVIISTKQGIGKNFFMKIVTKLLGGKNVAQLYSDNITNNFNSSIATSQLIVINESIGDQSGTYASKTKNAQAMARIKSMITDYSQPIERKGHDIVTIRTYTNFLFFSNDIAAVSFDGSDRRFWCVINDNPPQEKEFYDSMDILKTKEGLSAILAGLMNMEIKTIRSNMTHTKKTEDDIEVMKQGMTGHEGEIFDDIKSFSYIFRSGFTTSEMFAWYCVAKFGLDTQKDRSFINHLRKQFFTPFYPNKKYRQAKQITIDIDPMFIKIRNGSDSVPVGGKEVHRLWVEKPKHNQKTVYADDFDLKYLKDEIVRCAKHFATQMKTGEVKPELALISKKG